MDFYAWRKPTKAGGGGAKEQDAPHAPCISRDIILNLPSGFDPAPLMGEEIEI